MPYNGNAVILRNNRIAEDIFELTLHCPGADLAAFVPGQFAQVEVPAHAELILKRPLSIHAADAAAQTVTFLYQTRGKGTRALAEAPEGTRLQAILPLGRGFAGRTGDTLCCSATAARTRPTARTRSAAARRASRRTTAAWASRRS